MGLRLILLQSLEAATPEAGSPGGALSSCVWSPLSSAMAPSSILVVEGALVALKKL